MTEDERTRKLANLGAELDELSHVYKWLGGSLSAFGRRLWETRRDAGEAFWERWRKQRYRAHLVANEIEIAYRDAVSGWTNDGPDKWTADLDALASKKNSNGTK